MYCTLSLAVPNMMGSCNSSCPAPHPPLRFKEQSKTLHFWKVIFATKSLNLWLKHCSLDGNKVWIHEHSGCRWLQYLNSLSSRRELKSGKQLARLDFYLISCDPIKSRNPPTILAWCFWLNSLMCFIMAAATCPRSRMSWICRNLAMEEEPPYSELRKLLDASASWLG